VTTHPLPVGAAIVLFSDGVIERSPEFTEVQLDEALRSAPNSEAPALADHIRQSILAVPATRYDDITALVVSRHA
jgi:serine/threonine protein phosphatase PrpC